MGVGARGVIPTVVEVGVIRIVMGVRLGGGAGTARRVIGSISTSARTEGHKSLDFLPSSDLLRFGVLSLGINMLRLVLGSCGKRSSTAYDNDGSMAMVLTIGKGRCEFQSGATWGTRSWAVVLAFASPA